MGEKILIKQDNLIPATKSQQEGKNNFYVDNQSGGIVNFNYNITYMQPSADSSAETIAAIQSFSKEYYQLIVTCSEDVFKDGIVEVTANRALTDYNTPPEIFERCSAFSEEGITELKRFPAIICQENTELYGVTSPNQYCMLCYIQKIMKIEKTVKIAFKPIAPIQQIKLCDRRNALFFGLNMDCAVTTLNYSAWSVRKLNVFEAFKEADIPGIPMQI